MKHVCKPISFKIITWRYLTGCKVCDRILGEQEEKILKLERELHILKYKGVDE